MAYEITKDCEIANTEYKKGDIVSEKDVTFYPSVMKKTNAEKKTDEKKKTNAEKKTDEKKK